MIPVITSYVDKVALHCWIFCRNLYAEFDKERHKEAAGLVFEDGLKTDAKQLAQGSHRIGRPAHDQDSAEKAIRRDNHDEREAMTTCCTPP